MKLPWWRLFTAQKSLFALIVLAFPIVIFVRDLRVPSAPDAFDGIEGVEAVVLAGPRGEEPDYTETIWEPLLLDSPKVDFRLLEINASSGTISTVIATFIDAAFKAIVVDRETGEPIAYTDETDERYLLLKPEYQDLSLTVSIDAQWTQSGLTFQVPLASLFGLAEGGEHQFETELPVYGTPNSFPSDWYATDFIVSVAWPLSVEFLDSDGGRSDVAPLHVFVTTSMGMANRTVRVYSSSVNELDAQQRVTFVVETDAATQIYTYAVSCIPLLVGLLLVVSTFRRRGASRMDEAAIPLEIIVGVLSVLPIRQLLVPESVPGLTRVDLLLSLGLCVIVVMGFWEVTGRSRRPPDQDAATEPGT